MSGFLTIGIVQTALELGLIYGLVALSLFISFSILNICDLSTDGCYTLGGAVAAIMTIAGHPVAAIFAAMAAGILSGFCTAILQTKFGVKDILAGIIVNTALYSVNLGVMGWKSNVAMVGKDTIFSLVDGWFSDSVFWENWHKLITLIIITAITVVLVWWFLGTRLGLSIRATGDSPAMVRASSINTSFTIIVGMCIANAFTGLAGALSAQYDKSIDITRGTGMVTVALASLIIGEIFSKKGGMMKKVCFVIVGSCIYRFIISIALRLSIPTEAFKLVSALIVAIAICSHQMKSDFKFSIRKHKMRRTE